MSWYYNWSDGIKKRACRYLLQRYLGQFLEEKLTLDQLSVNIYNGTGSVSNVSLDVQALNELGEQKNLPVEFVDGFMAEISVSIPWATLLKDSIFIEVSGMQITIQPRQRDENGESMLESMWSSVASSMQLAAECLKQDSNIEDEKVVDSEHQMEGLEIFAQTIESVLTRVKIKFIDTTLRIEHLPKEGKNGIAVEIRIKKIEYCDETSCEDVCQNGVPNNEQAAPLFTVKKFHCDGISFYTDEFPCEYRTFSRSVLGDIPQSFDKDRHLIAPILIGKLSGIQEIRLKSKKVENLSSGPKFELEFSLGSLSLFLSPRQLYLLIEVVHSLSAPHTQDSSNVKYKKSFEKVLNSNDYRKIEQDLHDTLHSQGFNVNANRSVVGKGWVSTSIEESDDEFFAFGQARGNSQSASLYSNNTDMSWEASTVLSSKGDYSHSNLSNDANSNGKKHENISIFDDLNGETTAFHIRLSSIAVIILHEDILTFAVDSYSLTPSSVSTMNNLSTHFFNQLGQFGSAGFGNKDFEASKDFFHKACQLDHIRILGAAVIIEGKEGGSNSNRFCNTKISAASLELLECLFEPNTQEPQYVELLKFMRRGQVSPVRPNFPLTNQPDLRIVIIQSKKTRPSHVFTKTDITFTLQQCWTEIDLSIYDRLSNIFTSQILCHTDLTLKEHSKQSPFYEAFENAIVTDRNFALKIQCPFFVIKFRFPIPDMRPDVEKGRHPWWKRSIRKDVLFVNLVDPIFQTEINYLGAFLDYSLQCSQISLLLQIGDSDTAVPFLFSAPVDINDSSLKALYEFPRVSVKLSSPKAIDEIEDVQEKEDPSGLTCSFMETPIKESTPFTSKRFVYKSDSLGDSSCEGEEVILPANKESVKSFISEAFGNAKFQIDIVLPYLHIDFSKKNLYEVLYNRFNSDVSLWQSSVSKIVPMNLNSSNIDSLLPKPFLCSSFSMCKSGLQLGEIEIEDENEDEGNIYKKSQGINDHSLHCKHNHQSKLALQIHINSGFLSICPNLKDSTGNIVPEKHGQIQFTLENTNFFTVSGYKGVSQKNYVCFQVENISIHHRASINNSEAGGSLNLSSFKRRTKMLKPIIYKSNCTGNKPDKLQSEKEDILTIALSSSIDNRRIKTTKISLAIKGATLRHYVTPSEHSWLTQLKDFFDVVDYPVKGYDSLQAITELHFNLEDSLVDYRPLRLQTKCVLYFGNFSISSNIAARTKISTLRFIAEEANLFISECNSKTSEDINLKDDYISVIDLGLFELSLRLSEQSNLPKVDLKASSDIFNIRTCSDSATHLAELITYYASNGDLNIPEKVDDTKISEPYLEKNDNKINGPATLNTSGNVFDMMEDAMKEINDENSKFPQTEENDEVEVFYFPGEGKNDDNDTAYDWAAGDFDSDNDFCFLDHEPVSPVLPVGTNPVVRSLSDGPIQIIENHFNAQGKTDFLLPPKYYPSPVYRYTLSDINLVWHMFGGNDFNCSPAPKKNLSFNLQEKTVSCKMNFNTDIDEPLNYLNLNTTNQEKQQTTRKHNRKDTKLKRSNRSNKWFTKGGSGRNHDVLMQLYFSKVRFQHEIYPDKTTQASRQVLLIHNFEIVDKLSTSQINKFLYQYTSETCPRQSTANMVMVKAVHLRPDTRRNVQETCLKVSMLPLRLNIDQDSLEFLYGFISQISTRNKDEDPESSPSPAVSKDNLVNATSESPKVLFETESDKSNIPTGSTKTGSNKPSLFIRNFVFSPDVPITIDYEGKRVNMSHGPMAGIIMGIGVLQLNCLKIKLKRLSYKQGLLGWDRLISYVLTEWIQDIKTTQFPCLIGGVGPMHALVQLFNGIKDLFWLPIEQYQKDGRIFRGMQRGANSFTTSTVIAALELTAKIVQAIQSIAEAAFDIVSPGPSFRRVHGNKSKKPHRYSHPADIREGVTNAYTLVKEGLEETAETLVRVASSEAEQKGAVGAVGGILRQIPPSMVAPIIIASAATSNLLGGVRNQLAPDSRREASLKWKTNET